MNAEPNERTVTAELLVVMLYSVIIDHGST